MPHPLLGQSANENAVELALEPSSKSLDGLEIGYLLLFAALLGTAWLGFTLAEVGLDRPRVVLAVGGVGLSALAVWASRRTWRRVGLAAFLGLLLPIGLAIALDFPPDEWILGGLDPGGYVNAGATIAKTGGIVLTDRLLSSLDPTTHHDLVALVGVRLPGFYQGTPHFNGWRIDYWTVTADSVTPHGFHFYPAVLAFGYAVGGLRSELLVTPILAGFGLAGFYLLGRRLFGTGVAVAASALLALSPAEVWFARYPAAEVLAQVLLFGALLALVATIDAPNRSLAALAGAGLGAVHLTKIETIPLPVLVAAFAGYLALTGRFDRRWVPFLVAYALVTLQAVLHALLIANWYAYTTLERFLTLRSLAILVGLMVLTLASVVVLWRDRVLRGQVGAFVVASNWSRLFVASAPVVIGVGGLVLYYVRPSLVTVPPGVTPDFVLLDALNRAQSFVRLGWYVTPLGLLLGTFGWMLLVNLEHDRRSALVLLVLGVQTIVFLWRPNITPVHYWTARRWIDEAIPGFCLAAAYLLGTLWPYRRPLQVQALLPLGLGVVLILQQLPGLTPLLGYVEYRGAIDQLGALSAQIPPNAVVLFPDGDAGQRFSTPLNYLFDRDSVLILNDPTVKSAAARAARAWLNQGRPVYWIELAANPGPTEIGLHGTVVGRQTIGLPEKLATTDRPPGQDGVFQQDLAIWRVQP